MSRLRKILGLNQTGYDRPNQPWVCGHACEGHGCQLGPDKRGHCQAGGECLPRRQGDRWMCTRTAGMGGPCTGGPNPDGTCGCVIPPCQPVRTFRSRRGLFTWAAVAVTLGGLLWAFGGGNTDRAVSPGPLSASHATSEGKCSDCHTISPDEPATGLSRLVANHPVSSANCLECHELGSQPLLPHGRHAHDLNQDALHTGDGATAGMLVQMSQVARAPIASQGIECATCHSEHHGRMADIRSINDKQCQVCHAGTFKSFSEGHPDFGDYPYKRRTRIIFDHASHLQKHFMDSGNPVAGPTSCLDCHVPGDTQGKMLVKGFAQTCASCHEPQIKGAGRAGAKGIAFFRIPGLDVETLESHGHAIGEWPRYAEGRVNPFIQLLLSSEPAAVADLALTDKLDPLDLTDASDEQLAASARMAWRIKALFFDLTTRGQDALIERLSTISGDPKPAPSLIGQLSGDTLLAAKTAWWPNLFVEVPNYRAGILPALPEKPKPAPKVTPAPASQPAGGDDILGDDILGGDDILAPAKPAPAKDDILGGDDILAGDDILTPPAPKKPASDDILGDDILGDELVAATPPASAKPAASDSLDDILGDLSDAPAAPAKPEVTAPKVPEVVVADPESWMAVGGWYRSDDTYTLYYRPSGHADPFIKAWVDAAGSHQTKSTVAIHTPAELFDPKSPGMCAKCHSVDNVGTASQSMNWHAAQFDARNHEATKFNHMAHFSLLTERGCQTCHVIAPEADYQSSYAEGTPAGVHHSNFQAMAKETCAACHQNTVAGNSCQLCHNYHQGLFGTSKLPTASTKVEPAPAPNISETH